MTHIVPEVGVSSSREKVTDNGRVSISGSRHQRSRVTLHWGENSLSQVDLADLSLLTMVRMLTLVWACVKVAATFV